MHGNFIDDALRKTLQLDNEFVAAWRISGRICDDIYRIVNIKKGRPVKDVALLNYLMALNEGKPHAWGYTEMDLNIDIVRAAIIRAHYSGHINIEESVDGLKAIPLDWEID